MSISLRLVTAENWHDVARLNVDDAQKDFVATNSYSLAQAAYEPGNTPVAAYADEDLVGFALYTHEPWHGEYGIIRLMIDKRFQGKGYGRQAALAVIDRIRALPGAHSAILNVVKTNSGALRLYQSLGFVIEREEDDLLWMRLAFDADR